MALAQSSSVFAPNTNSSLSRSTPAAASQSAPPSPAEVSVAGATLVKSVKARQIIDSRGNPTIEVDLVTDAPYGSAVPSGASTGIYEAFELRDGDKAVYGGKGVLQAVRNINEISALKLVSVDVRNQTEVDAVMLKIDGSPNGH